MNPTSTLTALPVDGLTKLVTVNDLTRIADPRAFVDSWQRYFWPILKRVRQGLLTSLLEAGRIPEATTVLIQPDGMIVGTRRRTSARQRRRSWPGPCQVTVHKSPAA